MRRHLPRTVVVVVAAALTTVGWVAPGRAVASPPTAAPAVEGYPPSGDPVTGGGEADQAAALDPGLHLDQLGPHETRYYSVEVPRGGTGYVSATTISTTRATDAETVTIERTDPTDEWCDDNSTMSDGPTKITTAALTWTPNGGPGCTASGPMLIRVSRSGDGLPVPVELDVLREPPVSDPGPGPGTPAVYTDPGGPMRPVVGGSSFVSATELPGSGHYVDTIAPSQWVFYRVRLEWGQSLAHQVTVSPGRNTYDVFDVEAHFYNPDRAELAHDFGPVTDQEQPLYTHGDGPPVTRPVRYRNRGAHPDVADYLPGWYYIAVHGTNTGTGTRTVRIDVSVGGTRESGPRYVPGSAGTREDAADTHTVRPPATTTPRTARVSSVTAAPAGDNRPGTGLLVGAPAAVLLAGMLTTVYVHGRGRRHHD